MIQRILLLSLLVGTIPAFAQVTVNSFTFPAATKGSSYGPFQLTATGGPVTWTVSAGALPVGLNLSSGGVVSGIVSAGIAVGPYNFTARATNGVFGERAFTINVVNTPTLTANVTTLPPGINNNYYTSNIASLSTITGGSPPYTFSSDSSINGLILSTVGFYEGVPRTAPIGYTYSYRVNDSNGAQSNTVFVDIVISSLPLALNPASLPNWTINRPYIQETPAVNGFGYYSYSTGGVLPNGLQQDLKLACPANQAIEIGRHYRSELSNAGASTSVGVGFSIMSGVLPIGITLAQGPIGAISGFASQLGTFNFRVGSEYGFFGSYRDCQIIVTAAAAQPQVLSCPLSFGISGKWYLSGPSLVNSTVAPQFDIASGSLPTGLSMTTAGEIIGIPSASGNYTFGLRGIAGAFNQTTSCSVRIFDLPSANGGSFVYGVPTTAGTFNFNTGVADEGSGNASRAYAVTINAAPGFNTLAMPGGSVNAAYSSSLIASSRSGGTAPFVFDIATGSIPPGLIFDAAGIFSGTATAAGTFPFTARVTDAAGATANVSLQIVIAGNNGLQITTSSLPVVITGNAFPTTQLTATGGSGTGYNFYFYSEINPPGLNLSSSGVLSGTIVQAGNYNFRVGVNDNANGFANRAYTLSVTNFACPISYLLVGSSYSSGVTVSPFPVTGYSITSGQLPNGFTLAPTTGQILGSGVAEGTSSFTITATDNAQRTVSKTCSITVQSLIQISSPRTTARAGVLYTSAIGAFGGNAPYSFSILGGTLPQGLTLQASTGLITGTPTTAGSVGYRIRVQDSVNRSAERDFSLYVLARTPTPTLRCPLLVATIFDFYSSALSVSTTGNYSFAIQGNLPTGYVLDPSTGRISGSTTQTGSFPFTATVTASGANPVAVSCNLDVAESATASLHLACPDQSDLVIGEPYASPAIATGGRRPYTYSLYQSSLPPGLSLSAETGFVFGTPTIPTQNYTYLLSVLDARGNSTVVTAPFCAAAVAPPPPLSISTTSLPGGLVGSFYSSAVQASGGIPPYVFSVSGALPSGLTLNPNTGVISGLPSQPQSASFKINVLDYQNQTLTSDFTIVIGLVDPLRLLTNFLESSTVGVNFTQVLQAAGGTPPYRFSLSSGSPAPGTGLSPDGTIRGVPTTAGTYRFDVELADNSGGRTGGSFAMAVFQGNFRLGCPNAAAELGVPYNSAANVLGGSQPFLFTIADGRLPGGLSLDTATGSITGRPTASGSFIFTFGVSDARQARTQTQCSITVQSGGLRILTEGPISVKAGADYTGTIEAAGGRSPYLFTLSSVAAEAGFTLAASGGYTGRATRKGSYPAIIQVKDAAGATASRSIVIVAGDSTLSLSCPDVSRLPLGVTTTGTFSIRGGVPVYRLSLVGGALPSGFEFPAQNSDGRPAFTARPLATGSFESQFQAVDDTNTAVTTRCTFEVTGEAFLISTDSLPDGTVGTAYSGGVASRGGVGRVRYSLASGGLPEGLELDSNSGAIGGTPAQDGNFTIGVSASDEIQRRASKSLALRILVGPLRFRITTAAPLSDGLVGRSYSASFAADGGKAPYLWSIDGLPNGLTAGGDSVSGTPNQAGESAINVTARDAAGATASRTFLLRIKAGGLTITTDSLPDGVLGEAYGPGVNADGGRLPLIWSVVGGVIPSGVGFDSNSGSFSGNAGASGQFGVILEVLDASGATARRAYTFEVRPPGVDRLQITTATLPDASAGVAYNTSVGASGGRAPYAWTINGDLPPGLNFSPSGAISGTPTVIGTSGFLITVTDSLGLKASRALTLRVATDTAPALSIDGLPDTTTSNQNLPFTLRLASGFGLPVTGRLTLNFVPDVIHGADDPSIRFSNSARTIDFTIPAGSTQVGISVANPANATGTLAGTIRIDSVLNFAGASTPGPTRSITVRRAVPVITNLRLTRTASTLELRIEGFTNTRQLSEARVTFTASGTVDLTTASQLTVNVQAAIQSWFASAASQPFGGQFALVLPFTVSGDAANITGVGVTIVNGEGPSSPATAN